jgi:CheY-like chemotaxis protein
MVHGFAQQSHGCLEIDSEPGEGTTVRLLLPLARAEPHARAPRTEQVREGMSPRTHPHTILAVDDDEDVLALAKEYLTGLGYTVLTASRAEEALAILEKRGADVHLLFTDVIMPGGMNGIGLAQAAARLYPNLAVLLTTGYNEEMIADGPDRPSLDVIGKPYRRSELADRVNAALNAAAPHARRSPSPFGAVEG